MSNAEAKYIRATTSSHLEVTAFAGAVDSLIAAGWVKEGLITLLWRARNEFDCLNTRNSATHEQNMAFAMMQMKTLPEARRAMAGFVLGQWAIKTDPGVTLERALELSGRCLQAYIAPRCPACRGLGFSGGYNTPRIQCRACRETGVLRNPFGNEKADIDFGQSLLVRLDEKAEVLARNIRKNMRRGGAVDRAKAAVCEAQSV